MAFNKSKALQVAQKLVVQGKLKEAIGEYLKIHRAEPKDQNTLNTLGDLYVRLQNTPEALGYYTKLADMYVSDGFLVRGIAMYKKITKLDPANIHAMERLGDLYMMQGLMSEARVQYLQLAEALLKANRGAQAMGVMQKLLDLDPENLRIQQRLAALYERHGKPQQAAGVYRQLGERLLQDGQVEESLKWLHQAAALAPKNVDVLFLQARAHQQAGHAAEALATLEKIPHLEENPTALELLLRLRLEAGEVAAAEKLAEKLFAADEAKFAGFLLLAQHATRAQDGARALALLTRIAEPALEYDPAHLLEALRGVVSLLKDSPEANELLVRAARQTGNHSALVDALRRQAEALCRAEEWPRARQLYNELVTLEPQTPEFAEQLKRVQEQLGTPVEAAPAEAAPVDAAPVEPAAVPEEELDEETQAYVNSTLTDVDLFSSYGMTEKAIELAQQVLARVPGHLVAHEKLLDMYLGTGNDRGVVEIGRILAALYRQANNEQRAEQVANLAGRYAEKLGLEAPAEPPAQAALHEFDLTAEWAREETARKPAAAETIEVPAPAFNAATEVSEEIGFYLGQGLIEQARQALARYEQEFPGEPALAEIRAGVEAAVAAAKAVPAEAAPAEPAPAEIEPPETAPVESTPAEAVAAEPTPTEVEPAEAKTAPAEGVPAGAEQTYEVILQEQPAEAAPATTPMSAKEFFSDLAGELDTALAAAEPARETAGASPAAPTADKETVDVLAEVFEQFKQEVGDVEEIEDIETHYSLGIAYKEMGLFDEAISEFQKVSRAAEKQKSYPQLFQSCTLLGLCFIEKGLPQLAVRWYERALKAPGIDEETAVALRYDLGVAHQQAGNHQAALDCFLEVYGTNVDYRNVSERIRELQGT